MPRVVVEFASALPHAKFAADVTLDVMRCARCSIEFIAILATWPMRSYEAEAA